MSFGKILKVSQLNLHQEEVEEVKASNALPKVPELKLTKRYSTENVTVVYLKSQRILSSAEGK